MATTSPSTKAPADSTTAPAAPTEQEVNTRSTAFNHFSQGKRHLLVGDFKSAVSAFKEATVALAELYGEQAPECGDAYYHYGRALLELARKEAGVLGGDLDGGSSQEGSTGEEEDDDEDESEESQEEEDGDKKEEEEEEEGKEEDADGKKKAKKEGEGADEGEGENTEEEEEVSTLQCAWEWLDVARVIFDKQDETPEISKKRAQIRLSLGEVCMESEDYDGAISEFQKCLAIQEEVLEKDDRCLAETHYQLGLGHCFSDNFDDAVTHFKAAVEVIQLKIKNLKARVEEKNTWSKEQKEKELAESKDVFYTEEGEIEDLEQLLPDIQHKIVDMEEMKAASAERFQQVAAKALLLGRGEIAGSSGSSGPSSSAAAATSAAASASASASASVFSQARDSEEVSPSKVSDAKPLSTLQVRRKRKPEEEEASEEKKKQRLENGVKSEAEGEANKPGTDASAAKPIAIKRKVMQNGKDASESPSKQSESSSKTESSSSAPSLPTPQDVK